MQKLAVTYIYALEVTVVAIKVLLLGLASGIAIAPAADLPIARIKLPPDFGISVLSADVPKARAMALGAKGTLFVGSTEGDVYALRIANGKAERPRVIAADLQMPVGVAFRNGALYVSAVSRILRFDDIETRLDDPPRPVVVSDRFPRETHHGWKFIAFGPDGWLYVPVGAPCNICEPDRNLYANIMRMREDGTGLEVYARAMVYR